MRCHYHQKCSFKNCEADALASTRSFAALHEPPPSLLQPACPPCGVGVVLRKTLDTVPRIMKRSVLSWAAVAELSIQGQEAATFLVARDQRFSDVVSRHVLGTEDRTDIPRGSRCDAVVERGPK